MPEHPLQDVEALDAQVITFASAAGGSIAKSDTELTAGADGSTFGGYAFTPNYLNATIDAGAYVLSTDGSCYELTDAETQALPFRPYFTAAGGGGAKEYKGAKARAITFNRLAASIESEEQTEPADGLHGQLAIYSTRRRIIVNSGLQEDTDVRIYNTTGALVRTFTIKPGQTVETQVAPGIYIVNKKKISVK